MSDIAQGMYQAVNLIVAFDGDLMEIVLRSLQVSLSSLLFASIIGLPLGTLLAINKFRGKRIIVILLNSMIGLPPVVVGLVVYILLSRTGPFGVLGLLFTPSAMIIAQTIIIMPLIASVAYQVVSEIWDSYKDLLISLNATLAQSTKTLLWDARSGLLTACLAGFGRAIGEVGAVMIVGGNIDHATRVLTTAIALETGKGDFALALALGIILIGLAVIVNFILHLVSDKKMGVGVNTDNTIVTLKNVNFQRNGDAILEEVNAEVMGNGICLVMGPNGSGKTSLLRVMNGLEKIQSGEIVWHTKEHSLRGNRSLVFQSPVLMRRNVIENVAYPQLLRGESRKVAYERARRIMQNLGLGTQENLMAHNLSGGEKQKMALARALIVDPQVLFLMNLLPILTINLLCKLKICCAKLLTRGPVLLWQATIERRLSELLNLSSLFIKEKCWNMVRQHR